MKNKKGFTLIELLAIIVILAIIAVITVPIILNVIDNSKVGAAKDSAYGYKDAVSKYYVTKLYQDQNFKLDGEYTVTNGKMTGSGMDNVEIPVSGNVPTSGTLVYKNNVLESGYLIIDGYKVEIEEGKIKNTSKDNSSSNSDDSGTTETGGLTDESVVTITLVSDGYVTGTASVSVEVTAISSSDLTYTYYKKIGSGQYEEVGSSSQNTFDYSGLEDYSSYWFKVVVTDSHNNSIENEVQRDAYCFVAGTKVYTEKGYINIEDIEVGDMVYAIDLETGEQVLREVKNTITSETSTLYHFTIGSENISSSPRHPFYIVDRGWVRAFDIKIGDQVITKDGYKAISDINYEILDEPIKVYNLEVEGIHNYLVTESLILVHNFNPSKV